LEGWEVFGGLVEPRKGIGYRPRQVAPAIAFTSKSRQEKAKDRGERMAKKVPNPIDKYVGSRVRMRRLMLRMSQEKLGDELGITFQQVQKYEKGTNRVSASRLQAICQILQVSVPFFFEGAPQVASGVRKGREAPSPDYVSEFVATSDGLKLIKAFMQIGDASLRRSVVRLVEEVAGKDER
jgi:transcriptional regulator with XRE-family HTH domain